MNSGNKQGCQLNPSDEAGSLTESMLVYECIRAFPKFSAKLKTFFARNSQNARLPSTGSTLRQSSGQARHRTKIKNRAIEYAEEANRIDSPDEP
jgi:hypothetical protein